MVANFQTLRTVADTLGLRMEPVEQSSLASTALLSGAVDGIWMEVYQWQQDYVHLYVRAYFSPPLDLGLSLEPAGLADLVGGLLGRHDLELGQAEFDRAFEVHAREESRAKGLFQPPLVDALLAWKRADASFTVTDEGLSLRMPVKALWGTGIFTTRDVHEPSEILHNLKATEALAKAFSVAAAMLPPSPLLADHAAALGAYAAEHGLTFTASPLSVSGNFGGGHLLARPKVGREGVTTSVTLRFARPLPRLLSVRARRVLDLLSRLGAPGHSVETGDAAFDAAFRVVVADGGSAGSLLSADARRGLLALHDEIGDLELDGRGVTVHAPATTSPAALPGLLDRLLELERTMAG